MPPPHNSTFSTPTGPLRAVAVQTSVAPNPTPLTSSPYKVALTVIGVTAGVLGLAAFLYRIHFQLKQRSRKGQQKETVSPATELEMANRRASGYGPMLNAALDGDWLDPAPRTTGLDKDRVTAPARLECAGVTERAAGMSAGRPTPVPAEASIRARYEAIGLRRRSLDDPRPVVSGPPAEGHDEEVDLGTMPRSLNIRILRSPA